MLKVIEVTTPAHLATVKELFIEYAAGLGVDLGFQNFEQELAGLPGDYRPPAGGLWLALVEDQAAGCVALRPYQETIAEMKRLYLRPAFRGYGAGRALALTTIERARRAGYQSIRLDTLPAMREAQQLYRSLGFKEIAPYRYNPVPGSSYMELIFN